MKIKHVAQEHDKGCVIACIAMVLEWEYSKVVSEFKNDFDKSGLLTDFAKEFICDHGFSVIEKRGTGYQNIENHNKRMMEPFAPIHILTVRQFVDRPKQAHSVIMDAKGRIHDPGDKNAKDILFYYAQHIMGFYRD